MHCLATAHQLNNLNIFFKDCLDDSDNTNSKLWSVYLDSIVDSLKDDLKYIWSGINCDICVVRRMLPQKSFFVFGILQKSRKQRCRNCNCELRTKGNSSFFDWARKYTFKFLHLMNKLKWKFIFCLLLGHLGWLLDNLDKLCLYQYPFDVVQIKLSQVHLCVQSEVYDTTLQQEIIIIIQIISNKHFLAANSTQGLSQKEDRFLLKLNQIL